MNLDWSPVLSNALDCVAADCGQQSASSCGFTSEAEGRGLSTSQKKLVDRLLHAFLSAARKDGDVCPTMVVHDWKAMAAPVEELMAGADGYWQESEMEDYQSRRTCWTSSCSIAGELRRALHPSCGLLE